MRWEGTLNRYSNIESKIQEAILKDGVAYINGWSTDCDGCSAVFSQAFYNMDDYYKWDEGFWEWQEGSQGYDFTTKDNCTESASSGNGIDGWEDMFSR